MISPKPCITAKIGRFQEAALKHDNDAESLKYKRNRKTGQRRIIWEYPYYLSHQLAHLLLVCLMSRSIVPALYRHNPRNVLKALHVLRNLKLIRQYILKFIDMDMNDLKYAIKVLGTLINIYGFDSTNNVMLCFWGYLETKFCLTKSMSRFFLSDNRTFDVCRIFHVLNQQQSQWDQLFLNRTSRRCIFCNKDVYSVEPILFRHLLVQFMKCCFHLCCQSCLEDFLLDPGYKRCPQCTTPYFYKVQDWECDMLASAIYRNQVIAANNASPYAMKVLDSTYGNTSVGSSDQHLRNYTYFTPQYHSNQLPLF